MGFDVGVCDLVRRVEETTRLWPAGFITVGLLDGDLDQFVRNALFLFPLAALLLGRPIIGASTTIDQSVDIRIRKLIHAILSIWQ
jgi:hypothetical protein